MQIVRFSVLSCLIMAGAGCGTINSTSTEMTPDQIVAAMENATAPRDGSRKITTSQVVMNIIGTSNEKDQPESISITCKSPDKIRFMTRFQDRYTVKGWDGRVGWEYSSRDGYRLLQGAELDEIKFQGAYLAPDSRPSRIFTTVKLEGTVEIDGRKCWKLLMTPDMKFKSQDLIFYVDQASKLPIKTEEIIDTATRTIQVETVFANYKMMDGIMFPEHIIAEVNGNIIETHVAEVNWDIPVDDQTFAPPASLIGKK